MKIKQLGTLIIGVLMMGMVSCEYETIVPKVVVVPDIVYFAADVAPMFIQAACTGCHASGATPDFTTAAKAYQSLISNNLVNVTTPSASVIIAKINEGHGTAGNLTATQKALLLKWIEQGAKNN